MYFIQRAFIEVRVLGNRLQNYPTEAAYSYWVGTQYFFNLITNYKAVILTTFKLRHGMLKNRLLLTFTNLFTKGQINEVSISRLPPVHASLFKYILTCLMIVRNRTPDFVLEEIMRCAEFGKNWIIRWSGQMFAIFIPDLELVQ